MKIYLGSDHQGFHLKSKVFAYLAKHGYDVEDVGDQTLNQNDDFPEFAAAAALQIIGSDDKDPRGILALWRWAGYGYGCKQVSWYTCQRNMGCI
jgi:ribose 5-phosphate isomerase RpiB